MNDVLKSLIIDLFNTSINGILILSIGLLLSLKGNKMSAQIKKQVLLTAIIGLIALFAFTTLLQELDLFTIKPSYVIDLNEYNQSNITYQSERLLARKMENPSVQKKSDQFTQNGEDLVFALLKNWHLIAFVAWFIGFMWILVRLVVGILGTKRLQNNAVLQDIERFLEFETLKKSLHLRQSVQIYIHQTNFSPITFGFRKPVIILPKEADKWSEERINIVLLHELIHIKEADFIKNVIIKIICAIFWFNPFIWIAAKKYRFEQEMACDEQVVGKGIEPHTYAKELLDLTIICNSLSLFKSLGSAMVKGKPTNTERRIMGILSRGNSRQVVKFRHILFGCLITICLLTSTVFFKFVNAEDQLQSSEVPSLWPLQEGDHRMFSSFGESVGQNINHGVDILWSGEQIKIHAAADGVVHKVGMDEYGYIYIFVKHQQGLMTYYSNLCDSYFQEGSSVLRGDVIGESSTSGIIHFEIRKGDRVVDPLLLIKDLPPGYM